MSLAAMDHGSKWHFVKRSVEQPSYDVNGYELELATSGVGDTWVFEREESVMQPVFVVAFELGGTLTVVISVGVACPDCWALLLTDGVGIERRP